MTNEQTKLSYDEELKQMKEEQSKGYEEIFPPSWKIPKGTTTAKFLSDERKTIVMDNAIKKILSVEVSGQPYSWWCNPKNPVYTKVIQEGNKRKTLVGVKFKITRIGDMKETRYDIEFE